MTDEVPPWEDIPPPTDDDAPGYLVADPAPFLHGEKDEKRQQLVALQERLKDFPAQPPAQAEGFRTVALRDLEPVRIRQEDRIWGDIVTRRCVTLLAGQPGIGKSTLTRFLIQSIAEGRPFLGLPVTTEPCGVLVVDYETPSTFRFPFWQDVFGQGMGDVGNVHLAINPPKVNVAGVEALKAEAERLEVGLVVIDTMSAAFAVESENNNSEMQAVMDQLRSLAESGPAVLVIVHPSKDGRQIRGASAIEGAVETVATFRAVVEVPGDGLDETVELQLAVKKNRVGGLSTHRLFPDGNGAFTAPDAATDEELLASEKVVFDIVYTAHPATITKKRIEEIAWRNGVRGRTTRLALGSLVDAGKITRHSRGVYVLA